MRRMELTRWTVVRLTISGLAVSGCEAETAELGARGGEAGATAEIGGEELWTGHIEGLELVSGSLVGPDGIPTGYRYLSDFTLRLNRSDTVATGTLTYGDGPAPAVDPSKTYPPHAWNSRTSDLVVDGASLSLIGGLVDGARLRFGVSVAEGWTAWCEAQNPAYHSGGMETDGSDIPVYSCFPPSVASVTDAEGNCTYTYARQSGEPVTLDCAVGDVCNVYCECTEAGCDASASADFHQEFDLRLQGGVGEGTVSLVTWDQFSPYSSAVARVPVRLERQ